MVRVLDEDPDLAATVPSDQLGLATDAAVAPVFTHEAGPWRFVPRPDPASWGALILSGLVVVRVEVEERAHVEVLGAGDLVSPWVGMGPDLAVGSSIAPTVVSELRLAYLDRGFALRVGRWPEIPGAIVQRLIMRSRRLSLQSAINSLTRTEERVELTLWQLAYRFGRITREGCALTLRLTHAQLADMIAAQRPSVTVALTRLAAGGRVVRHGKDQWLLRGSAPPTLSELARKTGLAGEIACPRGPNAARRARTTMKTKPPTL